MAGSTPGLVYNQEPTAAQWNSYFAAKQDWSAILQAIVDGGGVPVSQSYEYLVPTTGFSITPIPVAGALTHRVILDPAGTLAAGTIIMPTNAANGQVIIFSSTATITALTVNPGSGQVVKVPPTTLPEGWPFGLLFKQGSLAWFPA